MLLFAYPSPEGGTASEWEKREVNSTRGKLMINLLGAIRKTVVVGLCTITMCLSGWSQNLIPDPGFEASDVVAPAFGGNWTTTTGSFPIDGATYNAAFGYTQSANGGNNFALVQGTGSTGLQTTFNVVSAQVYRLTYFSAVLDGTGSATNTLSVFLDGVLVPGTGTLEADASGGFTTDAAYTQYTFLTGLLALGAHTLRFDVAGPGSLYALDDVSLVSTVPELNASHMGLPLILLSGALLLVIDRRRLAAPAR